MARHVAYSAFIKTLMDATWRAVPRASKDLKL